MLWLKLHFWLSLWLRLKQRKIIFFVVFFFFLNVGNTEFFGAGSYGLHRLSAVLLLNVIALSFVRLILWSLVIWMDDNFAAAFFYSRRHLLFSRLLAFLILQRKNEIWIDGGSFLLVRLLIFVIISLLGCSFYRWWATINL